VNRPWDVKIDLKKMTVLNLVIKDNKSRYLEEKKISWGMIISTTEEDTQETTRIAKKKLLSFTNKKKIYVFAFKKR
jgi:hypothetical protein